MENGRRYKIERETEREREREKKARAESPQDSPPWRIIAGGCGCCSIFELAPARLWPLVYAAVRLSPSTTKRGEKGERGGENRGGRERGRDGRERHTCALLPVRATYRSPCERDRLATRATCERRGRICCARAQISREYVSTRLMNIHVNKTAVSNSSQVNVNPAEV